MQQSEHKSEHKSPNLLRSFGLRFRARINPVILPFALVLLALNIFCSIFIVGEKVDPRRMHISTKLDQITQDVQPVIQNWLNATDDSLAIQEIWLKNNPNSWDEQGVKILLFQDSTMVYWSNYTLLNKLNKLGLTTTGSIRKIGTHQVITQYYKKDSHHAVVVINLYNSETERYNETIFPEQRITLLPLNDSVHAHAVKAETISAANNQFYIEPKPMQGMPWWGKLCGWGAILFLCLYIKNVIRYRTNRYNVFKNAGILMLCFLLTRAILHYTGIPNLNGALFDKIFGQHNIIAQSMGDMILNYGMAFIYIVYIFQVRFKFKWHYHQLPVGLRISTIILCYVVIALLISVFHYVLIMLIHEPNINIQIYNTLKITYATATFYILSTLLISILLLIIRILYPIVSTHYLWLRICLISILIIVFLLPFESLIQETGYLLVFLVAVATGANYLRLRYSHYGSFAMSLIIFSAYVATVAMLENRTVKTNNQILYARILATSQQDRDIISHEDPNASELRFHELTYARVTDNLIIFKHNNNIEYQNLNSGLTPGLDTTLYRDGYSHLIYNYYEEDGKNNILVISKRDTTILNTISLYVYIYLILFSLCFLLLETVGYTFNIQRLSTRMTLKIQGVIIGVVIFTMVSATMVITNNTLDNFRNQKRQFIHNNSQRLQVSLELFLENNTLNRLSASRWTASEANDAEYSINIFTLDGKLLATSDKKSTISRMNSDAYRELHYLNHPFVISEINLSQDAASYSPIISHKQTLGYLNLQEHNSNISNSRLEYELRADIINLFLVILCLSIILSYILYHFLAKPFNRLREAMSNISKMQKIDAVGSSHKISDEVGLLVEQYNLMIDELAESYRQLAHSEREGAWREMAQQVAHEIKNPLTPMRLKIQMLQRAMQQESCDELRPKVESTMMVLLSQIELLNKITSDFSNFAVIGEGNPKRINIIPIIWHVANLYCDFKNIGIHFILNRDNQIKKYLICSETTSIISEPTDSSPIWVNADPDQLTRAFVNICQNSIQALLGQKDSCIEIELRLDINSVWIAFHDNGPGIPESIYDKLFMPKFTTKSDGSGLGLPISQRIITSIGGHISFESIIDVDTTFIIELPLHKPQ